jgi:hypothetical protein
MFILSGVYSSILNLYSYSFLLSVMMLPGALFAKFFISRITFENKLKAAIHIFYIIIGSIYIVSLGVTFAYWYLFKLDTKAIPLIIMNPIFISIVLIFFIGAEYIIKKRFFPNDKVDEFVEFVSDRKTIKLPPDEITYIESRDIVVFVHALSGKNYRTKMRISQWEELLDKRFIRVHRSFIVNERYIEQANATGLIIAGRLIEVSRKYKDFLKK